MIKLYQVFAFQVINCVPAECYPHSLQTHFRVARHHSGSQPIPDMKETFHDFQTLEYIPLLAATRCHMI